MQTIRMGSHIRILRVLGGPLRAETASAGATANIVHITTSAAHCNDRGASALGHKQTFAMRYPSADAKGSVIKHLAFNNSRTELRILGSSSTTATVFCRLRMTSQQSVAAFLLLPIGIGNSKKRSMGASRKQTSEV